jgi:hypothetical protein
LPLPPLPPAVLEALRPPPAAKPRRPVQPTDTTPAAGLDASPRTLSFLAGHHAEGPGWNQRLFNAACDLCGLDVPLEKAEPLLLAGARPWNQGEEELARRTIHSAYSRPREPARL